jgi:hypothetical protein
MRCALPMELPYPPKILGVAEFAGGAQAMRPYQRKTWGFGHR